MKKYLIIISIGIVSVYSGCKKNQGTDPVPVGKIYVTFEHRVKTGPLFFNVPAYTNSSGEPYSVSKFKYYISGVSINNIDRRVAEKDSYHLIDASNTSSLTFSYYANVDQYNQISFLLGVDSARNVSGAQTGALDPLNDMFWTWNTGYIMAKLEGTSTASTQVNNKIEYHIGGFAGSNNVLKKITLTVPSGKIMDIRDGKNTEIIISADVDAWWQNPNIISFAANPVCTTPGPLAKQVADNYSKMFTVKDVINN